MPNPLLATKLYLPAPRPSLVPRPRLTGRLEAGLQRPLTLISAPAGFGKSALLTDWRATSEGRAHPLAWLSLDPGDNDPDRFWAYVMAALRALPDLAGLPDELDPGAPPDLLLAPLVNGLEAAANNGPVVLVFDDYHTIEAPAIHTAVSFLVEHMPDALRLVVLTRSDPAWPMARLRAHGFMSELRTADLRFTAEEATEFLTRSAGLILPAADIATVEQRTEGWIAALQMVALSLGGHPDPREFVAAFSGQDRYITDYLTEEVLARQPEPLRRFLLLTSVLDRLSAPLCAAVTGCPDARALLDRIERANLFLVPLDGSRQWFRFHHLFRDLLRAYLQESEPETIPLLHSRAAAWHEENGLPLEAAGHSLAAGDYDRTVKLLEQHAGGWWAMANMGFGALMRKLPPEVMRRSPLLCAYQAWMSALAGQVGTASDLIDAAEAHAPLPADIQASLGLTQVFVAELAGKPYKLTDAVLRAPDYIPEEGASLRSPLELALAFICYMNGQLDRAAALCTQAAEREVARRTAHAITVAIPLLATIRLIQGQAAEAADLCRRYIAIVQERGAARYFVWGNIQAMLAEALLEQGDPEEAEAQAREALRVNQAWEASPQSVYYPLHALARVRLAQGEAREALNLLDTEAKALSPEQWHQMEALRVQAWLMAGDLEEAQRWAKASGLGVNDALSFRLEIRHISLARVLLATGRQAEGEALLARLERAAEVGGRPGRLAEIRGLMQQAKASRGGLLSDRELEILHLIAAGRSNQEIAELLVVAVGTVKTHVHNLFYKLGAQSRIHAVARARELRLLK